MNKNRVSSEVGELVSARGTVIHITRVLIFKVGGRLLD